MGNCGQFDSAAAEESRQSIPWRFVLQFVDRESSSALDDIEERVSLAAHAVIVVDGSINANDSENETSLCRLDRILLASLLMSRRVICKADATMAAASTMFFTKPRRQLPPFASA